VYFNVHYTEILVDYEDRQQISGKTNLPLIMMSVVH